MENRRETMETVTDFIFSGSKITADGDCSREIKKKKKKKHLHLGKKAMTNLDNINAETKRWKERKRDDCFADKGPSIQHYGFSNSHMITGPQRKLSAEGSMLLNYGVGKDS